MNLSHLRKWLSFIQTGPGDPSSDDDDDDDDDDADCPDFGGRPFVPAKRLCERDYVIIDMLNSQGHEIVSFCVTDPQRPDNPVIYVNHGFEKLTGYGHGDVVGRNCRFLQGPETSEGDRRTIRDAIEREKECSVNLVNYKKDGTKFVNEVS
jgi:PAS domain-containing protein